MFFTCYDVALLFWVFCKHVYFNVHERNMLHMALELRRHMSPVIYFLRLCIWTKINENMENEVKLFICRIFKIFMEFTVHMLK